MVSHPIQQALLLATHTVTIRGRTTPLSLVRSGGIPLIKRTILTCEREGVRRFVVVYADPDVRRAVESDPQLAALDIVWVCNAERASEDGFGLLRARSHLRGEFFVVPVDRVFSPRILDRLLEEPLDGVTLAVREIDGPVATGELGLRLGAATDALAPLETRGVETFTADDADVELAGIAAGGRALFEATEMVAAEGGLVTLTRAFEHLARDGRVRIADVRDAQWQDLHTVQGRKTAQGLLVKNLRKSVDGIIARHVNRRFSLAMSRWLMNTPVRPNHVTAFSLLVSIGAAFAAALATAANPLWLAVGAVLWQLASMLDGIDGELARLKFAESKIGEWFDTLTDDVGKFVFFIGSGIGMSAVTGQSVWLVLCVVAVAVQMTLAINLYRKLLKTGSGSHYALAWETKPSNTLASRLYHRIEFMSRRDYYVFAWMVLVIFGFAEVAIVGMFATTCVILVHELVRPRQVREEFVIGPPAS
jgi:1L-myo-inositol 1-phosphate cytidylyltransferase / CDP-L-myo-inositol myo-inositolphosphotransferase